MRSAVLSLGPIISFFSAAAVFPAAAVFSTAALFSTAAMAQPPALNPIPPAPAPVPPAGAAPPASEPTLPAAGAAPTAPSDATLPQSGAPAAAVPTAPVPTAVAPAASGVPVDSNASAPVAGSAAVAAAEEPLPPKVSVGKRGFFQPAAQLQFWAYGLTQEVNGEQDITAGFRLRRAELRVKGEIVPKLFSYNAMIDPSRALEFSPQRIPVVAPDADDPSPGTVTVAQPNGATTILQDVILTLITDYADVSFGQFKLPIGYEAYNSTAKLLLPEFALVTRHYSARRDLGIKVDKKLGDHFYYRVDLLNGAGQNRLDNDDQKDGALRLEVYPVDGLVLGAAGYIGLNERDVAATKDRVEADLKVDLANVTVQAEFVQGWDGATGDDDPARVEGRGFYATAGYTFDKKVQPVVRVGHLNPHVGTEVATPTAANDRVWSYEAGANYFIEGNDLELQLSAGVFDYENLKSIYQGVFEVQVNF